jgi:hypothetical protein
MIRYGTEINAYDMSPNATTSVWDGCGRVLGRNEEARQDSHKHEEPGSSPGERARRAPPPSTRDSMVSVALSRKRRIPARIERKAMSDSMH